MIAGIVVSGIIVGLAAVTLGALAGYPVLVLALLYPAAGLAGVLLFLAVVMLRCRLLAALRPRVSAAPRGH